MFKEDKILHFAWSAFITYFVITILDYFIVSNVWDKAIGFAIGMSIGIAKEIVIDTKVSWGDLVADFLGCLLGVGLGVLFTYISQA